MTKHPFDARTLASILLAAPVMTLLAVRGETAGFAAALSMMSAYNGARQIRRAEAAHRAARALAYSEGRY